MHGDERCSKDRRNNNHKLHAWVHAVQCEDTGRIPELAQPEVKVFYHIDDTYVFWLLMIP